MFHDGDVLIVSPTGKQWKLHSLILAQSSPILNKILAAAEPAHLTKKDRDAGKTVFFKLEMVDDSKYRSVDPEGLRYKAFKSVGVNSRALTMPPNINGLGEKATYNEIYDNFFRCMYNLSPEFRQDDDPIARDYIIDCTALLQAADFLDAIPVIRVVVEAHLLRLNQILWHHISEKAENWIHIAAKLHSPLMFRECMIHLVGKYHLENGINQDMLRHSQHGELGAKIWQLIEFKAKELKDKKLKTERHLMEFFPARLAHKDDATSVPGRAIYANDIYFWQALALCRQYFASAFMNGCNYRGADGGLAFYRTVAEGAYLRVDTLDRFHATFEMSSKGKVCLNGSIDLIKNDFKPVVKDLLIDRSQATRGPDTPPFAHFTCTEILDEEFPWYEPPAPTAEYKDDDLDMMGDDGDA
ncbi:uncharacterized protein LY89DRAFT_598409 [Mollisia scopiformis]|uniref:BTB domain-containing protein n=1 Tax=Mollisia scopiformis TaxID=149040 RepID=A0A132BA98_MOLSC|nr:uncharacterized protein LY89DRAFT_598409 [Mollisia scopiformis]KUJ09332.1 hypothetical protein LY89DRAFT_598409 [Mollisia scopiformis]